MARDPQDIVLLANILLADKTMTIRDEALLPHNIWHELSIGILDSEWGTDPSSSWKWGSTEVVCTTSSLMGFP